MLFYIDVVILLLCVFFLYIYIYKIILKYSIIKIYQKNYVKLKSEEKYTKKNLNYFMYLKLCFKSRKKTKSMYCNCMYMCVCFLTKNI